MAGTAAIWSPYLAALLVGLATLLLWQVFAPARRKSVDVRLNDYLQGDVVELEEMARPFGQRVVAPTMRRLLSLLGALMPKRNLARIQRTLIYAGEPGRLTALDFLGLRLLTALLAGGLYYWFVFRAQPTAIHGGLSIIVGILGYMLPWLWLQRRARGRQNDVRRALPDALDMVTIGVEAGLAFESALLRVGEQWDNALSDELRTVVAEMRVGITRNAALEHMVARTGVEELATFVAVLVQSTQLGVSIAQVLHSQADQMREARRQRAEELARQASVKIVLVLVVCYFPVLFVVLLGPMMPQLMGVLNSMAAR
jgi:tight adherence protein C